MLCQNATGAPLKVAGLVPEPRIDMLDGGGTGTFCVILEFMGVMLAGPLEA